MQLTIDTQKDSKEDIRKAIAFLSSISDNALEHHTNIFESSAASDAPSSSNPVSAFGSMFSDNSPATSLNPNSNETFALSGSRNGWFASSNIVNLIELIPLLI